MDKSTYFYVKVIFLSKKILIQNHMMKNLAHMGIQNPVLMAVNMGDQGYLSKLVLISNRPRTKVNLSSLILLSN